MMAIGKEFQHPQELQEFEGLDGALRDVAPPLAASLRDAFQGRALEVEEIRQLMAATDPACTEALLAVAGFLRTRHKGHTVTYSPKVFLPITNLCRDRCSYCTFRADPSDAHAWTMRLHEVQACCSQGRSLGCIEALMCLGDKPELAFRSYRDTLAELGHESTISYVHEACGVALREGMLPHTNAGLMSREEMTLLRPVNVSMGLMLENISPRLRGKGEAHYHAPDKDPQKRLSMLREAGELAIPFTTGILLGIGETPDEVVDSLEAIRQVHLEHGHIQEIIVQNFRAKPTTRMATHPEPSNIELARAIALTRLMLPEMNIQVPPNLSPYDHRLLLAAGINDWGGISPLTKDYVNPEAPWPHIEALAGTCREQGFELRPRLPIYEEYIARPGFVDPALHPAIRRHVEAPSAATAVDSASAFPTRDPSLLDASRPQGEQPC